MILSDGQILDSVKFNALVQDQATRYQQRLPLTFLNMTEVVNADDDEITGYYTGKVYAADLIADDQEAAVYEAGQLEYVTNSIPNLKVGKRFSQSMLNRLNRIKRNYGSAGTRGDVEMFNNWEVVAARDLIRGVNERMNALICAMLIDAVTYNRLGIQLSGTWGMPSDLKSTPSTAWTSTSATPITDILTMKQYAMDTYGEVYDKLTLSHADFLNMAATTEFKQLLPSVISQPLATTAFNARSANMPEYASLLLKMEIVIEDKQITTQAANGTNSSARVLPLGKVLLSTKADEKDPTAWDFGNAVPTESIVAGLVGDPDNFPMGEQFGPMGYFTGNADLNPPNLIAWGVARGFPRKQRKTCTSVLTVQ
jgi:hypothetical protein